MRMTAGLDRAAAAKLLHVTERTLHNWETGIFHIPYAAYKLVRILTYLELPHPTMRDWKIMGDALVTPEGYTLRLYEFKWWSHLYRKAELFAELYAQNSKLRNQVAALATQGDSRLSGRSPLDLSLGHFGTSQPQKVDFSSGGAIPCPARLRYRFGSHLPQWSKGAV